MMDHDHITGAFRAWVCHVCNNSPKRTISKSEDKLAAEIAGEFYRLGLKTE